MISSRRSLTLGWLTAIGIAISSATGLWDPRVYAHERPLWMAQGVAQDAFNLLLVAPVLIIATVSIRRSTRAWLAWVGRQLHVLYSAVPMPRR